MSTRKAATTWGLAGIAPWHWLRGTESQLAKVWQAYRIFVRAGRGDIVHTPALYLLDRRGYERSGYLYPFLPKFVHDDLKELANAPRGA